MPAVRGLEEYLRSLQIIESRPLHELKNCKIGIDVFQFLRSNNFSSKEPLHSALGGLPLLLEKLICKQLFLFHKWSIQPLFIFSGIKYSQNARAPFSSSRSRKYAAKRKQAWKLMSKHQTQKAIHLFSQISGYVSQSTQNELFRIFAKWNSLIPTFTAAANAVDCENKDNDCISNVKEYHPINWFRAPFYAAAQLAFLQSEQEMLHAVCGGCDLLMFGCEKVILNINFNDGSYDVTDLDQVLYALSVTSNPYSFVDTCLLSGFDASRTFEPLTLTNEYIVRKHNTHRRNFSFEYALEKIQEKGSGIQVIDSYIINVSSTISKHESPANDDQKNETLNNKSAINLDQILQHMLVDDNEKNIPCKEESKDTNGTMDDDEQLLHNKKYGEYRKVFLEVRHRVLNAKVLSFGGQIIDYHPFKALIADDEIKSTEIDDNDYNSVIAHIPNNIFRLLSFGIIKASLVSAIVGRHLIDTSPLINSQELAHATQHLLSLRCKTIHIMQHAFGIQQTMYNQRWFIPNKDLRLEYRPSIINEWIDKFTIAIQMLFDMEEEMVDEKCVISIISPVHILFNAQLNVDSNKFIDIDINVGNISKLMKLMYVGTLLASKNFFVYNLNETQKGIICSNISKTVLSMISNSVNVDYGSFKWETVLAIEMLMNNDLNDKELTLIDENGKTYAIDPLFVNKYRNIQINAQLLRRRRVFRLISRLCCLLQSGPFLTANAVWTSELSHSLAAFNHISVMYYENIRNLMQSVICWLYCLPVKQSPLKNISVSISADSHFLQVLSVMLNELPSEPSIAMGVLLLHFLHLFCDSQWLLWSSDIIKQQQILNRVCLQLKKKFNLFGNNIKSAIVCGLQFFYHICRIATVDESMTPENKNVIIQFQDAHLFLNEAGISAALKMLSQTTST